LRKEVEQGSRLVVQQASKLRHVVAIQSEYDYY
jgi:hypothetical protein